LQKESLEVEQQSQRENPSGSSGSRNRSPQDQFDIYHTQHLLKTLEDEK
jgi:hypothetical protein